MDKIEVVLVVLNKNGLNNAFALVNLNNAVVRAIVVDEGDGRVLVNGDIKIPMFSFAQIHNVLTLKNNVVWLICESKSYGDIYKFKKFLTANGISDDNIVNFDVFNQTSQAWIGNLRYIEENGADYFATGISYTEVGLDMNCIPALRGVNLATSNQDLRQGYLTAKYVFEHVPPNTIKFVLIGLSPYSLRYDNLESFAVCARNFSYELILKNSSDESKRGQLLRKLVSDGIKNSFGAITSAQADLNLDNLKRAMHKALPADDIVSWEDEVDNLNKPFYPATFTKNLQILEDYIKLCINNGAVPVAFILPFAPLMRQKFNDEILLPFRRELFQLQKIYNNFRVTDLFDLPLDYSNFYNMSHINLRGANFVSNVISYYLYALNVIPAENFSVMNYQAMYTFSQILTKDTYNDFVDKVFEASAEKIRRKDKVRVGFVTYDASMWCGDELYNKFAQSDRYEPTVFLCLRRDKFNVPKVVEDFQHGIAQFQADGLNVVGISDDNAKIPQQDLLIFLTPYFEVLPQAFQFYNLTAETLFAYIPYGIYTVTPYYLFNTPMFRLAWKYFFDMKLSIKIHDKFEKTGMPRGYFSGYPKDDLFFSDKGNFEWKMARPNAKKIIYAPHWSIDGGVNFATFQWNYKFMYDFAKAHPEISWIFKPHPNLLFSAVETGLFPSAEAFNEYLQKWNDLPNAKVVTGAYYQDIFKTSDGMIHDSCSFIAEYQYTHKPMIFLTRDTKYGFNDFTNELMQNLYLVDGKDLDGIANLMQKIFIDGNDEMYQARMNIFDKYLNYVKSNGMLASEYIFRSIAQELG